MISTLVKLKTINLARKVVLGAFINGALIGATVVVGGALASRGRTGECRLCNKTDAPNTEG